MGTVPNLAVAAVSPSSTVFPNSLHTSFVESLQFPVLAQDNYHDNTIERSLLTDGVSTPRALRTWHLSKRLTVSQFALLFTFFTATVEGGLKPFYFYPDPRLYDATGASASGRITCIFLGNWSHGLSYSLHTVGSLSFKEIA